MRVCVRVPLAEISLREKNTQTQPSRSRRRAHKVETERDVFFLKPCPLLWKSIQHPGAAPAKQQGRKTTTPCSASRPVRRTTPALHHCIKMPLCLLSKGNSQTHIKTCFSIFSNTASLHAQARSLSLSLSHLVSHSLNASGLFAHN